MFGTGKYIQPNLMFASKAGADLSEAPLLSSYCKDFFGTCPLDGNLVFSYLPIHKVESNRGYPPCKQMLDYGLSYFSYKDTSLPGYSCQDFKASETWFEINLLFNDLMSN